MKTQKNWLRLVKCGLLIFGVTIIPLFYSYFYLDAFWDPYSKLDTVPVAVVNNDKGATINGKFRNLGDEMVNRLKTDNQLKWVFTNDQDAKDGLQTGKKYYSVITIPSDFSAKVATADTTDKEYASIVYSSNEKRNYLATQILHSATIQLEEKLRSEVAEDITGQLVGKLNDVPSQLDKLNDGLTELNDGTTALSNGLNKLGSGSRSLTDNLGTLNSGIGQVYSGSQTLNGALGKLPALTAGIDLLNSGANQLSSGLNQAAAGASKLNSGASDITALNSGITKLDSGASQVSAGAAQLSAGTQQYVQTVNTMMTILKSYNYDVSKAVTALTSQYTALVTKPNATAAEKQQAESIKSMIGLLTGNETAQAQLAATGKSLTDGAAQVSSGAAQVSGGAAQLKANEAKLAELQKGIADLKTAIDQLNAGGKQVSGGTADLAENTAKLKQLQAGVVKLTSAMEKLQNGSSQLYDGSKTLQNGISSAEDGAAKLQNGIQTAQKKVSDSAATAKQDLKKTDGLSKYAGEGVSVKAEPYNAVPNYGTSFAPYFLSLSMWVGALMMLFGIYLDPTKRIKKLAKGSDSRFVRMGVFFSIGVAQSVLLALVLRYSLGLKVNHEVAFYFAIILGSMVFTSIVQFCVVNLGDVGKFLAILFLILQLTSCGGTFPMETVPGLFNALYKFMPMTYTVEMLREIISGNDMGYAWHNAWILIGIWLIFAAFTAMFAVYKRAKQKRLANSGEIHV